MGSYSEADEGLALQSIFDVWRAEAAADLGIAPSGLVFVMLGDVIANNGNASGVNGGTFSAPADGFGTRLTSGGGATGMAVLAISNRTGTSALARAGASEKWWAKVRMAVNLGAGGLIGSGTVNGFMIKSGTVISPPNSNHDLVMGVDGAVSTTNFVVSGTAGVNMDSGVAIDNLVKDHKVYRANGTDTIYQINGSTVATGTARPNASGQGCVFVSDSGAVAQLNDVYLMAMAFPVRALGA